MLPSPSGTIRRPAVESKAQQWASNMLSDRKRWGTIDDGIDDLVLHAGFFTVGHTNTRVVQPHSDDPFIEFAYDLTTTSDNHQKHDMIRNRFRKAMAIANPIILKMKVAASMSTQTAVNRRGKHIPE